MASTHSPSAESETIPVGRIVGVHGLKGFLKVALLTDFPERFEPGARLRLDDEWREVLEAVVRQGRLMIKLEGVKDRTTAERLVGKELQAYADRPELEEDEFMVDDLIALDVFDQAGRLLGKVTDVLPMPAQDVLLVGEELMIPMVREFVKEIDLEAGRISVHLIPGMLGEDAS